MKFGAHQTFHLRDSWLYKGLQGVHLLKDDTDAMINFGIGKNMVSAMKFWLTALKLVEQSPEYKLTELAKKIKDEDPYFERDGTLLLLHYLLACNKEYATAWYWFFNKFSATEFDSDSLLVYYASFIQSNTEKNIKESTLKKDISCLLRCYKPSAFGNKVNPETENPSPFSKFEIIVEKDKKYFRNKVLFSRIEPEVFVYLIYLYWLRMGGRTMSMELNYLTEKEYSPGLILGLEQENIIEMIEKIDREYPKKYLTFSKTGGYNIFSIEEKAASHALDDYYQRNEVT